MPPRRWRLWIEDILEAISRIQRYTQGVSPDSFATDEKTIDAVLRNLEVIGEAAARLPEAVRERHPEIPWAEMRGLRNKVMHEYFRVDVDIIWQTSTDDLPPLVAQLEGMLGEDADDS